MSGLRIERDGGLVRLTLDRPAALNALDTALAESLRAAARALSRDASVRSVLLAGAGSAFAVGGDLEQLREAPVEVADRLIRPLNEALWLLAQMDAPVVVALHGAVAGGGLSLAAAADLAIAADDTRFRYAYTGIAASGDLGISWTLPRLLGLRRALELALLDEGFDAVHALAIGLVNRVVPAAALATEAEALAQRLAQGPTRAYGRIRRLMRSSADRSLAEQLDAEHEAFLACAASADFREGIEAFFAHRAPHFEGR